MECIDHFSHKHRLSFFQLDDDEDPKPHRCTICCLPILSSPSYTCGVDPKCNFFLHKPCAELPREFYHPFHLDTLVLTSPGEGKSPQNFTYRCRSYPGCKFDLHPLVEKPMEMIKSRHISHASHPLVAFSRKIVSLCNGCGEEQKGFFFYCQDCNFWIHQDCTILPTVVKSTSHPHPYILAYSLTFNSGIFQLMKDSPSDWICSICSGLWCLPNSGVYFCGECWSLAHLACVKQSMKILDAETKIIHLPDEEDDTLGMIRQFVERNASSQKIEKKKLTMTKYHQHSLILHEAIGNEIDLVCDACIKPVNINSSPFYRCQEQVDCHFLAHDICANHLPASFQYNFGSEFDKAVLYDKTESCFDSVFICNCCRRPSNGFCYKFSEGIPFDVECAFAPKTINHASHKQHILFLTYLGDFKDDEIFLKLISCCSGDQSINCIYKCVVCNFSIHARCALLPKKTRHKFDDHPLELITTHHDRNQDQRQYFCELCEQEINLKFWYYGCHNCEQYFHINCIPSLGYMSKVKFGKTLSPDDKIHPQHPLTLTRMLTHGRHERCENCKEIIKGFSDDEMAFHCSLCDFWIHFICASTINGKPDFRHTQGLSSLIGKMMILRKIWRML